MAPGRSKPGTGTTLPAAVRSLWLARGWTRPGDRVLVACSGGLDSLVLLHLLRFPLATLDLRVAAAHFDHAMRAGSEDDARWLAGLARAWEVPLHTGRAEEPPGDEAEARRLRYGFLRGVRRETGARWVLTAHHADDQIETVLFRILRGTGIHGLRGIPRTRGGEVLRPLLDEPRARIASYARAARIPFREDPTNRDRAHRRNRVRLDVLPLLEEVHPGARAGILRLARNAARAADALDALVAPVAERVVVERDQAGIALDRDALLDLDPPVRLAVLRGLLGELGPAPTEAGTRAAVEFVAAGSSGSGIEMPAGIVLSRDFGRIRLGRASASPAGASGRGDDGSAASGGAGRELRIPGPGAGSGRSRAGDRAVAARWAPERLEADEGEEVAAFDPRSLRFPLILRGWSPGDRTRTHGGGRKVKKLLGELRVPRSRRRELVVVVDGGGEVIWIPGLHRSPEAPEGRGDHVWTLGVADALRA